MTNIDAIDNMIYELAKMGVKNQYNLVMKFVFVLT